MTMATPKTASLLAFERVLDVSDAFLWQKDNQSDTSLQGGAVTTLGTAFRQPKQKQDFYTLFDNWVLKGETPSTDEQHYVMAVLIRGGVFGASGKE